MMKHLKKITLLALTLMSTQLFAHGMLGPTFPTDGAMMHEPTDRLEVNFNTPMKLVNLKLISSSGKPVAIDFERSKTSAKNFTTPVSGLKPDNYTVHWKAIGDDGHLMKGSYHFMQH